MDLNYSVRKLEAEETENALLLVWNVFQQYEAPDYTEEGITEFYKSIHDENFIFNLCLYGAFLQNKLIGIIATRNQGTHIALFFVDGNYQGKGIGRKLFETVRKQCSSDSITVNSSPYAVPVYHKLGFQDTDTEQVVNGLRFTPMKMTGKRNYKIRTITEKEYSILEDFLYEAIFIPEGVTAPPKEIIYQPELQVYTKNFGKQKGDMCLVAEADNKIIGVVWVRIMNDYGHIDDETPSFAISLYKEYRNHGIGTALMKEMLSLLRKKGYKQTSLAVQKANYAVKMYKNVGFKIIDENEEEYIMLYQF